MRLDSLTYCLFRNTYCDVLIHPYPIACLGTLCYDDLIHFPISYLGILVMMSWFTSPIACLGKILCDVLIQFSNYMFRRTYVIYSQSYFLFRNTCCDVLMHFPIACLGKFYVMSWFTFLFLVKDHLLSCLDSLSYCLFRNTCCDVLIHFPIAC